MSTLTISEAFARYGVKLRNVQWSVSGFNASGELVICLWNHHYRKSTPGTMCFVDHFDRWGGPGNTEFRRNVHVALAEGRRVRLIVVKTKKPEDEIRIQQSEDASNIPKEYFIRQDLVGEVVSIEGENYSIRFRANKSDESR